MDNLNSKPEVEIKNEFKIMNSCFTKMLSNLTSKELNKIEENEGLTNEISNHFKKISDILDDLKSNFREHNKHKFNNMDIDEDKPLNKEIILDNCILQKLKENVANGCEEIKKKVNEQEKNLERLKKEYSLLFQN